MDKQKIVEEIAKIIGYSCCDTKPLHNCTTDCNICIAESIYDTIYRDAVVLTKEEFDDFVESKRLLGCYIEDQKILLQMANSPDPFWFCTFGGCEGICKECKNTCEMSIFVQTRKEMAEKFAEMANKKSRKAYVNVDDNPREDKFLYLSDIDEICKKIMEGGDNEK